jgi:hypothetical protein
MAWRRASSDMMEKLHQTEEKKEHLGYCGLAGVPVQHT